MTTNEWRDAYEQEGCVDLWVEEEFNSGSRLMVSSAGFSCAAPFLAAGRTAIPYVRKCKGSTERPPCVALTQCFMHRLRPKKMWKCYATKDSLFHMFNHGIDASAYRSHRQSQVWAVSCARLRIVTMSTPRNG